MVCWPRKWLSVLGAFLFTVLTVTGAANAQDAISGLKIGALDSHPYNLKGESTFLSAYKSLLRKAGLHGDITLVPFKRGAQGVSTGGLDLMVPLVRNKKREETMLYTDVPYMKLPFALFSKVGGHHVWTGDLEDLNGKRLSMLRGAFLSKRMKEKIDRGDVSVQDAKDLQHMITLVNSGRVDMGISSLWAFKENVEAMKLADQVKALELPYKVLEMYIVVSRKTPRAKEIAERLSDIIKRDGQFVAW